MFEIKELLDSRSGDAESLHLSHLNHQLVKVLRTLGFDRDYVSGKGAWLFDSEGNRYLDFLAGFGVYALGRSHPVITKALHDAIDMELPSLVQMERSLLPGLLAEQLSSKTDGLEKVFFTNSGAESIETAIKFARFATRRKKIVAASHAFHGLTTGALALNGSEEFKKGFDPLIEGVSFIEFGDIDALEKEISNKDVAAFVVEPIQGKGVFVATPKYWSAASEICNKYGTLLVVDEVQTGLNRTGKFFAYNHYGISPDIVTVAKALSGGFMPIGAVLMRTEIHKKVYSSMDRAMVHSSTFGSNLYSMVAGLATLKVMEDESISQHVLETGRNFMERIRELSTTYDLIGEVRGEGFIIGIELVEPKGFSLKSRWKMVEKARKGLFAQLIVGPLFTKHRILTQVAGDHVNIIKLLPPLISGEEEIDYFMTAFEDVLREAYSGSSLIFDFGKNLIKASVKSR
ncbi:MAG: aspartate aminotransferase family protein [Acidimicrobiales bacterium]|nr:aspartate aminotransferase family protein [Acidimicrobiales bacterium]